MNIFVLTALLFITMTVTMLYKANKKKSNNWTELKKKVTENGSFKFITRSAAS